MVELIICAGLAFTGMTCLVFAKLILHKAELVLRECRQICESDKCKANPRDGKYKP